MHHGPMFVVVVTHVPKISHQPFPHFDTSIIAGSTEDKSKAL